MKKTFAVQGLLVVAILVLSTRASASIVTLDFEAAAGSLNTSNYFEDGFRMSPNCHYDVPSVLAVDGVSLTRAIGWDSNVCPPVVNPSFLGPPALAGKPPPVIWIDYNGAPFSLTSLDAYQGGWQVQSSAGGVFSAPLPAPVIGHEYTIVFSGAEWTNIDWLLFSLPFPDVGEPFGLFDNLVLAVDEPPSPWLLAVSLAVLAMYSRLARVKSGQRYSDR